MGASASGFTMMSRRIPCEQRWFERGCTAPACVVEARDDAQKCLSSQKKHSIRLRRKYRFRLDGALPNRYVVLGMCALAPAPGNKIEHVIIVVGAIGNDVFAVGNVGEQHPHRSRPAGPGWPGG
jgi:hypothetical protein